MPNGARDPTDRPASSAAIRVHRPRRAYGTSPTKARSRPRCGGAGPRDGERRAVNVLALYDIHGNLDALEAVLADPRARGPDPGLLGGAPRPGPFPPDPPRP